MKVVVAGDVCSDIIVHPADFPKKGTQVYTSTAIIKLGGSAANTARVLGKLGSNVIFYGCVGNDFLGKFCENELKKNNVETYIRETGKTGLTVAIEVKDRTMVTFRGANDELLPKDIEICGDWFHFSGFWNCRKISKKLVEVYSNAKEGGCITSFDPGSFDATGKGKNVITELKEERLVDFFFMSREECDLIFGSDLPENIVLHLGKEGALLKYCGKELVVKVKPVEQRVRTGAGDALNAGFIHEYLKSRDPKSALKQGVAIAKKYVLGLL